MKPPRKAFRIRETLLAVPPEHDIRHIIEETARRAIPEHPQHVVLYAPNTEDYRLLKPHEFDQYLRTSPEKCHMIPSGLWIAHQLATRITFKGDPDQMGKHFLNSTELAVMNFAYTYQAMPFSLPTTKSPLKLPQYDADLFVNDARLKQKLTQELGYIGLSEASHQWLRDKKQHAMSNPVPEPLTKHKIASKTTSPLNYTQLGYRSPQSQSMLKLNELGSDFRAARQSLSISVQDLADETGIAEADLRLIERGEYATKEDAGLKLHALRGYFKAAEQTPEVRALGRRFAEVKVVAGRQI